MKDILMQYRSKYSNSCILVVCNSSVKVYDNDSMLLEFITNIESNKDILSFEFKYLNSILELLRKRKINYIAIDSDINYQIYDYYFTEYNNYIKYYNYSKLLNKFKRKYIILLNKFYGRVNDKYNY